MKTLCAAVCGLSGLLLLAGCGPETPPGTSPVVDSPAAMYAAPAPTTTAVAPAPRACTYMSRTYASGTAINPPELPSTTLQCMDGNWHSI
jgi:hypothetical protein